jgi:hypothetical protein
MMIAMAISATVMSALAAVMLSVSQGWQAGDGTQSLEVQSAQVNARVRHYLSSAKYIGAVSAGSLNGSATTPGYVFFWAYDGWLGQQDGGPEIGEMELIVHDPTSQTLWLYQTIPYATMTTSQQTAAGQGLNWSNIDSASWVATFEGLLNNYVMRTPIGHNVTGATFAVDWPTSTTQRPVVEYTLVFNRSPQGTATQYDTAMLRAPTTQPN